MKNFDYRYMVFNTKSRKFIWFRIYGVVMKKFLWNRNIVVRRF